MKTKKFVVINDIFSEFLWDFKVGESGKNEEK